MTPQSENSYQESDSRLSHAGAWWWLGALYRDDSGATAVEYTLFASLMAAGIAGGIGALGDTLFFIWDLIQSAINNLAL